VRKHFNGNGVIASMEHCNDFMFLGTEAISLGRVGMSLQLPMDRFVAQKSVKLQ
jgi:hypothetical protein